MDVLLTPLLEVFGKRNAGLCEKYLSLTSLGDLLNYFPKRYVQRSQLEDFSTLVVGEDTTLVAYVVSVRNRSMRSRSGKLTEVVITDDLVSKKHTLQITFFNQYGIDKFLFFGVKALFSGSVALYKGRLVLNQPSYHLLDEVTDVQALVDAPIPVYSATAKLPSWKIHKMVCVLLGHELLEQIGDPLPEYIVVREKYLSVVAAYKAIHLPESMLQVRLARKRFRFQEAFILQTVLLRNKVLFAKEQAVCRVGKRGGLLDRFLEGLPFVPTRGQEEVCAEIYGDLSQSRPMHRLLQGEVGSGKTLVALLAMLRVVDSGAQAVLLAPTEVLAGQHFRSITGLLGGLGKFGQLGASEVSTKVVLLTGSQSVVVKRQVLLDIVSGQAGIVIGTHALFADRVDFFDLALVVVDEQHRFGVEQRGLLKSKAKSPPHLLVMTATPIPRTVAMTVFGDLDVSTLTQLPVGRAEISSYVVALAVKPQWWSRVLLRVREEVLAGHQVYVVCPRIGDFGVLSEVGEDFYDLYGSFGEDSDSVRSLAAVVDVVEQLRGEPVLEGVRVAGLHGQMDAVSKEEVMADFVANRVQVLVSTTVIEVGVDVHNATMMVVLDADRFGISQLHQLRGRVGRGGFPGLCLFVSGVERGHPSLGRLEAVAATVDGFELSLVDLRLRREGDVLGSSQSGGKSQLKILRVLYDEEVIVQARQDAAVLLGVDPGLVGYPFLCSAIEVFVGLEQENFLERG